MSEKESQSALEQADQEAMDRLLSEENSDTIKTKIEAIAPRAGKINRNIRIALATLVALTGMYAVVRGSESIDSNRDAVQENHIDIVPVDPNTLHMGDQVWVDTDATENVNLAPGVFKGISEGDTTGKVIGAIVERLNQDSEHDTDMYPTDAIFQDAEQSEPDLAINPPQE